MREPRAGRSMLAARLRSLRAQRGLTQVQVADYLDVGRGVVGHWENGVREPGIDALRMLARVYNTSVSYLTGETNDPMPPVERTTALGDVRPEQQIKELGAFLRSQGATEEDVRDICGLLEHRRKLRSKLEDSR